MLIEHGGESTEHLQLLFGGGEVCPKMKKFQKNPPKITIWPDFELLTHKISQFFHVKFKKYIFWPENDRFRSFRIKLQLYPKMIIFRSKINSKVHSQKYFYFTNFTKNFSEKQISLKFEWFPLKLSEFYWNFLEYSNFTGIFDFEKSSGTANYWKFQIVLVTTKIFITQSTGI